MTKCLLWQCTDGSDSGDAWVSLLAIFIECSHQLLQVPLIVYNENCAAMFVKKRDGASGFCLDCHQLNYVTTDNAHLLLSIRDNCL